MNCESKALQLNENMESERRKVSWDRKSEKQENHEGVSERTECRKAREKGEGAGSQRETKVRN